MLFCCCFVVCSFKACLSCLKQCFIGWDQTRRPCGAPHETHQYRESCSSHDHVGKDIMEHTLCAESSEIHPPPSPLTLECSHVPGCAAEVPKTFFCWTSLGGETQLFQCWTCSGGNTTFFCFWTCLDANMFYRRTLSDATRGRKKIQRNKITTTCCPTTCCKLCRFSSRGTNLLQNLLWQNLIPATWCCNTWQERNSATLPHTHRTYILTSTHTDTHTWTLAHAQTHAQIRTDTRHTQPQTEKRTDRHTEERRAGRDWGTT